MTVKGGGAQGEVSRVRGSVGCRAHCALRWAIHSAQAIIFGHVRGPQSMLCLWLGRALRSLFTPGLVVPR